jgi:predicted transcriptional regulator
MNQVAVAPEVLDRFHELAEATHRSEEEIINEALTSYLAADRRYAEILTARVTAADRGEFASEAEVTRFFSEYGEAQFTSFIAGTRAGNEFSVTLEACDHPRHEDHRITPVADRRAS